MVLWWSFPAWKLSDVAAGSSASEAWFGKCSGSLRNVLRDVSDIGLDTVGSQTDSFEAGECTG
jgi:hypothetical protein